MPRAARIAPADYIYHVLMRGNNRQDIFKDEKDYEKFIGTIKKYKERFDFKLYHYVFMRNHVHLVIEPAEKGGSLAQIMKGINLSYAQSFKGKYRHFGHFWQDRYKSILISNDEYLLACGSYVELNPVRAGVVEDPQDYKWSSYSAYAHGKNDKLIDEHPIYKNLSEDKTERRKKYREFVKGMIKEKKAMEGEMDKRMVYGNKDFTERLTKEYEFYEVLKPVGRPKKEEDKEN